MIAAATWETTELVPGDRLTQHLKGFGYELDEALIFTATAHGTRLTVTDTLVPTSLVGRIMVAMSRGIMERDIKARCAKLKMVLEADAAPPA